MRKWKFALLGVLAVVAIAQFIQPERANPPVEPSATFESVVKPPQHVAAIISRSCRDCHTNQTVWPWYSRISPVSWLLASDVSEGRARLNFSTWNVYGPEMSKVRAKAVCNNVRSGDMPPWYYTPLHPGTGLSQEDISSICSIAGTDTRVADPDSRRD